MELSLCAPSHRTHPQSVVMTTCASASILYYRRLWLFSACAYKLRLQETMRLTDNVRLTSGIIVATRTRAAPSMRKHVKPNVWSNKRQERRRWQAPQCQTTLFFFAKVWSEATIFSKGYGLQEQKRLYKFDKKQETLTIENRHWDAYHLRSCRF